MIAASAAYAGDFAPYKRSPPLSQGSAALLTPTERKLAELILQAMPPKEIADFLGVSHVAVLGRLRRIRAKLRLREDEIHCLEVQTALLIHERRHELGVRCQACGEI
jgi:DNA-binding CsgD family transcriptional regulator